MMDDFTKALEEYLLSEVASIDAAIERALQIIEAYSRIAEEQNAPVILKVIQ